MSDELTAELRRVYAEAYDGAIYARNSSAEAFRAALLAVYLAGNGKWISLAERCPEHGQKVLISDGRNVSAAEADRKLFGDTGELWWVGCGFSGQEWEWDFEPTHWQPLPEPPQPEGAGLA